MPRPAPPSSRPVRRAAARAVAAILAAALGAGCTAASGASDGGGAGPATASGGDGASAPSVGPAVSPDPAGSPGGSTGTPVPPASIPYHPTTLAPAPAARPLPAMPCPVATPAAAVTAGAVPPGATPAVGPGAGGPGAGVRPGVVRTAEPTPSTTPSGDAGTTTTTRPSTPTGALDAFLADDRIAGDEVSVSVWIDGVGELAHAPDALLRPASNQKLVTAAGILAYLDPGERLRTDVVATGPVDRGTLHGDIVLVGGGDPSLTKTGPHSVDALAAAVAQLGITKVEGHLLVDEGRFDTERHAPGVPPKWWEDIGSLSALAVDRNWDRLDPSFLTDPALHVGEVFRAALAFKGVAVERDTLYGSGGRGIVLAHTDSATVNEMVNLMLLRSDNFYAEMLVKEVDHRATGRPGTTAGGMALVRRLHAASCAPVPGTDADASGLSYDNRRSARELRTMLQRTQGQPWGSLLFTDLPLVGASSAFGTRLKDPATTGRMRAKGGRLDVARSLSGFTATRSGRSVVFSVIVNGPKVKEAEAAIDRFMIDIASLPI